jgi:hypothetical protein
MGAMATLHFDGKDYREADLLPLLRDAARGVPDTDDRQHIHDGAYFASRLVQAARGTPLWDAVGQAVGQLLRSDDPAEVRLAVSLQFDHRPASASDTLTALARLATAGQHALAAQLAAALDELAEAGRFPYTQALRAYAGDHATKKALMRLYLRHDRSWVAAHAADLFKGSPSRALSVLANGTAGFSKDELRAVARDLAPAFASLPADVAQALSRCLEEDIAKAG